MAKKVYVLFSVELSLPTFELVDPDISSLKQRTLSKWDVKQIFTDPKNVITTIGGAGYKRMSDFTALEKYFNLPKDVDSEFLMTREHKSFKGLREQYITLRPEEMVIVVYQRFPSSVFAEPEFQMDQHSPTVDDFFSFVVYYVKKEPLPVWGRNLIRKGSDRTIIDAVKLPNDWYATWTSNTFGGDIYEDPWTTEYIDLIHKDGKVIRIYDDGDITWNGLCFSKIRLSRSGKSIVITQSDSYQREIVIPLSKYLSK